MEGVVDRVVERGERGRNDRGGDVRRERRGGVGVEGGEGEEEGGRVG